MPGEGSSSTGKMYLKIIVWTIIGACVPVYVVLRWHNPFLAAVCVIFSNLCGYHEARGLYRKLWVDAMMRGRESS